MHVKKQGVQTTCYIHGYHVAVGKLLVCERVPRNAVYGQLLDAEKVITHLP